MSDDEAPTDQGDDLRSALRTSIFPRFIPEADEDVIIAFISSREEALRVEMERLKRDYDPEWCDRDPRRPEERVRLEMQQTIEAVLERAEAAEARAAEAENEARRQ